MALVPCPECLREVSTEALSCPQCALPHPGKQERHNNGNGQKAACTCTDCGQVLPIQSKTCPQCGAPSSIHEEENTTVNEEVTEETWLCPHCEMPYTRRARGAKTESLEEKLPPAEPLPVSPPVVQENPLVRASEAKQDLLNEFVYVKERKKNPLWGEAHVVHEDIPQFPRPRKRLSWTVLVLLMIVLASLVSIAVLGLQGLNPLEALVYWQM